MDYNNCCDVTIPSPPPVKFLFACGIQRLMSAARPPRPPYFLLFHHQLSDRELPIQDISDYIAFLIMAQRNMDAQRYGGTPRNLMLNNLSTYGDVARCWYEVSKEESTLVAQVVQKKYECHFIFAASLVVNIIPLY